MLRRTQATAAEALGDLSDAGSTSEARDRAAGSDNKAGGGTAAEAKLHPTLVVFDGRLLDEEGRDRAYFNFKPPMPTNDHYWRLVTMMRRAFHEYLGGPLAP